MKNSPIGWKGAVHKMWKTKRRFLTARRSDLDRFMDKVQKQDDGCWRWSGHIARVSGYGQCQYERRLTYAHRASYQLFKGSIPSGFQVHHTCQHRYCVNPEHLELKTHVENTLLNSSPPAHNAKKDYCKRGHRFDEANTLYYRFPSGRLCRFCLECRQVKNERRRLLRLAARGHDFSYSDAS